MSCYHLLKGFPVGVFPSGKTKLFVTSYDTHHVDITDRAIYPQTDPSFHSQGTYRSIYNFIDVPCGHCIGCRLAKSREWANRMMLELEYHDSAYFATLTYNDDFVPVVKDAYSGIDEYGNEKIFDSLTLRKSDVQDFNKRLRRRFPKDNIRFYAAGEYGDNTFRPHYHIIYFGLHLDDLVPIGKSVHGFQYYSSEKFSSVWRQHTDKGYQSMGFCSLASVSWETCAYVARYVMKKQTGKLGSCYNYFGIEPPFSLQSNKPGLARQWYEDHPDIYAYDYINLKTPTGGLKFKPPKYYDKLYDLENHDDMERIKSIRREMVETSKRLKLKDTDMSYMDLLAVEEAAKAAKIKSLKRSL